MAKIYNTFSLDDYISHGFRNIYDLFIKRCRKEGISDKDLRIKFANEKIYIGSIDIGKYFEKIKSFHGSDTFDISSTLHFYIVNGVNSHYENGKCWFEVKGSGEIAIVYVTWDILNPKLDDNFDQFISHETQHLISSLYESLENFSKDDIKGGKYYTSDQELIAYCYMIIKKSIKDIFSLYTERMKGAKGAVMVASILKKIEDNKVSFANLFLSKNLESFFNNAQRSMGSALSDKDKARYKYVLEEGFNLAYEQMAQELRTNYL